MQRLASNLHLLSYQTSSVICFKDTHTHTHTTIQTCFIIFFGWPKVPCIYLQSLVKITFGNFKPHSNFGELGSRLDIPIHTQVIGESVSFYEQQSPVELFARVWLYFIFSVYSWFQNKLSDQAEHTKAKQQICLVLVFR